MANHHNDKGMCPLFDRKIEYGECCEVQEIREDSMDMSFAIEKFEIERADEICEKCKWYIVR